jgi:hypothetical protein
VDLPAKTLDEYRDEIAGVLNRTAIEIGTILIEAKYAHPRQFHKWVEEELPFAMNKAHQLMAISRAFRELPAEKKELLPAPWTTLFTLTKIDRPELEAAIEAGVISPSTTGRQALALIGKAPADPPKPRDWKSGPPKGTVVSSSSRLPVSLLVRELLRYDPSDLTPTQRHDLEVWLAGEPDGEAVCRLQGVGLVGTVPVPQP